MACLTVPPHSSELTEAQEKEKVQTTHADELVWGFSGQCMDRALPAPDIRTASPAMHSSGVREHSGLSWSTSQRAASSHEESLL